MTAAVPIESAEAAAATRPDRIGVLLVNLGTPDSADARGVRVYLKEFLSDPRVIENQGLFWKLALNGFILRTRPARKARDYRKIWNLEKNESPLDSIVLSAPPNPQRRLDANMDDKLEVIGFDLADERGRLVDGISPGRTYHMKTYYRVLAPVTSEWEAFIHIDGYHRRHNGDHKPMNGAAMTVQR